MPVGAFLDMDEARRIHAPMDSATEESSVMLRLQIEQQLAALTSAEDRSKDVLSKAVDERIRVTKAEALADAENFGKIGVGYFKKGDHGLARKYFTKAIACAPMTLVWWESRADTYLALKEFAKAVSDLEILQKFGATPSSSFFVKISRSYMATGDIMSAIQSIDAALGIEPENTSAQDIKKEALRMREHLNTLHSAQQHKQWTTVRHEVNELRSSCEGPGAPEWKTWLVRADIAERKWHDALSNLSLLDETSADHLTLRALVIFLADSDLDAMTKALNDALKMDPDHAPAKSLLRRSEDVMRLSQDAMSAFQAQDPSTALQKYNQGLALLGEEEAEGRGGLMRARFLSNQAFVFFQIGKYAEALSSANASLTLGPSRFYPLWTRARAQNALGRHDAAVEDYKAALAVAPDDNARRNTNNGLGVAKGDLQKCLQMNYYDLLGVSRRFSLGDLTKAYRNKCLLHHPDKSNGVDLIFKALQEAYAVLSDPQLRGLYDRRPH
ncbi:TPR-like protein [Sistotremastrum suecicum HHB10207 ss-3]|uniref:TPR-like protein n=1 Tax=Sistotremastrum suecicum HHB10207 ss-3 TaxID=1314776 RepID=A0A166BXJ9_9AGAM|nr:TPR-like protein [Sistotremastrum suecicum HHB10207 ss-3]